jgi:hypothetical protein
MRPSAPPVQAVPLRFDLPFRAWILGTSAFTALSATFGGLALVYWQDGSSFVPLTLLERTIFRSFLIPGLLLLVVVGGSSVACSICAWRQSERTIDAAWLAGGSMTIWIVAEVGQMGQFHPLQLIYGALGVMLLVLSTLAAHAAGSTRQRWVVTVTLFEGLGFLAPLVVALLVGRAGLAEWQQVVCIAGAGGVEGALLGLGQATAWPLPIRKARYVMLSSLAALAVWFVVLLGRWGIVMSSSSQPIIAVLLGLAMLAVGLTAIGGLQALELRRVTSSVGAWVAWTALAWIVALPLSFLPSPLVDERTPLWTHLALWSSAGFMMAYAMALVTGYGVTQLTHADAHGTRARPLATGHDALGPDAAAIPVGCK